MVTPQEVKENAEHTLQEVKKRIRQLEKEERTTKKRVFKADGQLEEYMETLHAELADVAYKLEGLKKEVKKFTDNVRACVLHLQDSADMTAFKKLQKTYNEFTPEKWITEKEFRNMIKNQL